MFDIEVLAGDGNIPPDEIDMEEFRVLKIIRAERNKYQAEQAKTLNK